MKKLQLMGQHATVVRAGIMSARIANRLMANLQRKGFAENPKLVRRIFLFETAEGIDYGFSPTEFGNLEPFFSIKIDP